MFDDQTLTIKIFQFLEVKISSYKVIVECGIDCKILSIVEVNWWIALTWSLTFLDKDDCDYNYEKD